jgi:tRNA U34 2-thiouridine synthase MnmA/TrmU
MDTQTRAFRIKNFIRSLPTYDVLYQRRVYGVSSNKCVRCNDEVETWDHLWKCTENKCVYLIYGKNLYRKWG